MRKGKGSDDIRDKLADIKHARRKKELEADPLLTIREALAAKLLSINERFCLMDEAGTLRYWRTTPGDGGVFHVYNEKDFKALLAKEMVLVPSASGVPKHVNPFGVWQAWPERREYTGTGMWPVGKEPPGKLNLWHGFGVEPAPGPWPVLGEFLRETICCGQQESYDYLLDLFAWKLQHPFAAPEVALALRGDPGVGKGTLARIMQRIFGGAFKTASSSEHVLGSFSDMLLGAAVMFLDEAFFAGDPRQVDRFKAYVTEPRVMIRPMYRPAFEIDNAILWIIASNHERVIDAMGKDRRHFVLEPSAKRVGDLDYYKGVHAAIAGVELQGMLHDLLDFDLSTWHPRQSIPQTAALADQKKLSLRGVGAFVHELIESGNLERARVSRGFVHEGDDGWEQEPQVLEIVPAFEAYRQWHSDTRQRGDVSYRAFTMGMAKWLPITTRQRNATSPGARRFWTVAPLPECVEHFERELRGTGL